MSKPGDRLTARGTVEVETANGESFSVDRVKVLEAIECPEVYRFKRHAGCRSCHGTGILWREVKDAEKKV